MAKEKMCDPGSLSHLNTGRPVLQPNSGGPVNNNVGQKHERQ
jgi:hypothetical protein